MHGRVVAGQRHDIAQAFDQGHQTVQSGVNRSGTMANMGGDQIGLGYALGMGKITGAGCGVFDAQCAQVCGLDGHRGGPLYVKGGLCLAAAERRWLERFFKTVILDSYCQLT
jgi:hypothetical protein